MSYLTVKVEIDHGRIIAREPEKLPEKGSGLFTILPQAAGQAEQSLLGQRIPRPFGPPKGSS
jgi:hypothetical protein